MFKVNERLYLRLLCRLFVRESCTAAGAAESFILESMDGRLRLIQTLKGVCTSRAVTKHHDWTEWSWCTDGDVYIQSTL